MQAAAPPPAPKPLTSPWASIVKSAGSRETAVQGSSPVSAASNTSFGSGSGRSGNAGPAASPSKRPPPQQSQDAAAATGTRSQAEPAAKAQPAADGQAAAGHMAKSASDAASSAQESERSASQPKAAEPRAQPQQAQQAAPSKPAWRQVRGNPVHVCQCAIQNELLTSCVPSPHPTRLLHLCSLCCARLRCR